MARTTSLARICRAETCGEGATGTGTGWVRNKWIAGGLTLLTAAALLLPLREHRRAVPKDSFPLSHYPMFSLKRSNRAKVTYLVGLDAGSGRRLLPYGCVGLGGLNQVRRQINRAVREGWVEALCETAAASPLLGCQGPLSDVVEVRVVTGDYRLTDYFSGKNRGPRSENILATRPVVRAAT